MSKTLVCLVEDNDSIRSTLKEFLEIEGYEVCDFEHGQLALDYLETQTELPHLLLLDLIMPVMTGWEFLKAVREKPNLQTIPIVILTVLQIEFEDLAPAVAYFKKPNDIMKLLDVIEQYKRS